MSVFNLKFNSMQQGSFSIDKSFCRHWTIATGSLEVRPIAKERVTQATYSENGGFIMTTSAMHHTEDSLLTQTNTNEHSKIETNSVAEDLRENAINPSPSAPTTEGNCIAYESQKIESSDDAPNNCISLIAPSSETLSDVAIV